MARSKFFVVGVVAGVSLAFLAACNVVLGLGDYEKVDADGGAADAAIEADAPHVDAPADAVIDVEAGTYDPARAWPNWPMPNPVDEAGLPNPASYDGGGDAGVVFDTVTELQWENAGSNAPSRSSVDEAQKYCAMLAANKFAGQGDWRLPTRIELVSLIDYTRTTGTVTIDPIFTSTPREAFWTASPVKGLGVGNTWTIDFNNGVVTSSPTPASARVRCVRAGKARVQ